MKIKIINCSEDSFWYSDKIGKVFTVRRAIKYPRDSGHGYEIYQDGKKYIDIQDAEIVFEEF